MSGDKINKPVTSSQNCTNILRSLRLNKSQTNSMLESLIQDDSEIISYSDKKKVIRVKIIKFDNDRYFAKINCVALSDVEDKQQLIKNAVEFAIQEKKLPVTFKNIGIGGVIASEGRLGFFSRIQGKIPPSVHAYVAFKLPGENKLLIEDPRTGIFSPGQKLQSMINDQVCTFAASAIFYFSYKAAVSYDNIPRSTERMFKDIYASSSLKKIIRGLEKKVGNSKETKEEVIKSFIQQILDFTNPVTSANADTLSLDNGKERNGLTLR